MPSVTIEMFEGRTVEKKRELAGEIADTISKVLDVKREIVRVKFVDLKKHDVAVGGQLISDKG